MRRPNKKGSVYKKSDKPRRNPWVAAISYYGKDYKLHRKYLGYYRTKTEALEAIDKYNSDPYDISAKDITFKQVFEMWSERNLEAKSRQRASSMLSSFNNCEKLHNRPIQDIKLADLQSIFDSSPNMSQSFYNNIKILMKNIYDTAIKHEFVTRNLVDFIDLPKAKEKKAKNKFTNDEIQKIYEDSLRGNEVAKIIVILFYTGYRITELLEMNVKNVNLEERYILGGGKKTKAGKNRIVPLHKKIVPFISERLSLDNDTLYNFSYMYFLKKFNAYMNDLGFNHTIHETRHTTASLLSGAGIDDKIIKRILGHAFNDLTEDVYIHKSAEELRNAIDTLE